MNNPTLALASDFFGKIAEPPGISEYGGDTAQGLIKLLNNILKIVIYAGGIYAIFNLIAVGIEYIGSSGNPETIKTATQKIWMTLLGLTVIASSLLLAALFGLILFGDATAILNPQLPGATP
jgi:hypothetical protein